MDLGMNFRATSTYVTDGAQETYSIGELYPTTRGGATFGWSSTPSTRDRSSAVDRRLAGVHTMSTIGQYFRVDLPAAGRYDVHLALGDQTQFNRIEWDLNDTGTVLAQYRNGGAQLSVANFMDATGMVRASADWPSQEAKLTCTFATTQLRLVVASTMIVSSVIAHLRVVSAGNRRRRIICGGTQ